MNIEELENYIELSSWAVCVDLKELPDYPSFLRAVIFYCNNRVCVEFHPLVLNVDEETVSYCGQFNSLKEAVNSIEFFLGKSIQEWTNYNKSGGFPIYVDEQSDLEIIQDSYERLMQDACDKKISLPDKGNFKLDWKMHFQNRSQYEKFLEDLDDLTRELSKQATITYGTSA